VIRGLSEASRRFAPGSAAFIIALAGRKQELTENRVMTVTQ